MPVIDLEERGEAAAAALDECDVCIVGTGPAGATVARELAGTRLRVTILESGGPDRRPATDLLNEIDNVGWPRAVDQWSVRNRILGGSSHTWGGRCAPFDEIDFERRPWVPHSGWPLDIADLESYLERSAAYLGLGVGTGFSDERFWRLAGRRPPRVGPNPALLRPFFWQFSRAEDESYPYEYTRFGRRLVEQIGPNSTLVTGATVIGIDTDDAARAVRSVRFATPGGERRALRAAVVVLCAGGIENPRILLASDAVVPEGLGNERGLVGRYLMDHPRGVVGTFAERGSATLQKRLGRYNVHGRFFRAGFRLSPEIQRAEGLLNCSAWLGEVWAEDDPWAALRRLAGGARRGTDVRAVVANSGLLARGCWDYFVERNGVPRKVEALELLCMTEQRPDPDSRVTLADRTDRFGMRLPRVDWRVHDDEARTMRRMAGLVAHELARMGLPAPQLAAWVRDRQGFPTSFVDVAHPTGTTRMAADPAGGVVDAQCRVHGVGGLYVAGSSVFPTAGHCNPTQMIVALAIRVADDIKRRATVTALPTQASRPGDAPQVLVTGATGRIGRIVVDDLVERGYRVRATTSKQPPAGSATVEWRTFDFVEAVADDYDGLVEGCAAVVHLGAELGKADRMPRVNADATGWLAEAAERHGVDAFCYTSTVAVYGSARRRTSDEDAPVLTHDHDVRSEYLAMDYVRAYGRTKLAGEYAVQRAARSVRYVILRPAVVVDVAGVVAIREWSRVKRVLAAHRHAHHVYVRDVSDAIIWAIERGIRGEGRPGSVETFNVAEDDFAEPTHAHFMRKAYAASGDPRFRVPRVPGFVDLAHDILRFRMVTLRRPLWRMRFPTGRLRSAGFRPRFGMAHVHALAIEQITGEARSDRSSASVHHSVPAGDNAPVLATSTRREG
jgi:choline dehydrogenase-like flavoprotein/nucleoside-diphosphate-sugar epimerase